MGIKVTTEKFRAAFVSVLTPKTRVDGSSSYQVLALFPDDEAIKALKVAAKQAATEKWGDKAAVVMKNPKFKTPFHDQGDQLDKNDELYKGMVAGAPCVNFACKEAQGRPTVVDEKLREILTKDQFQSGDYARAQVDCYAWEHPEGGRGISFGLESIQRMGRGEPLGGASRTPVKEAFAPVDLGDDEDFGDLLGGDGGDDELPF